MVPATTAYCVTISVSCLLSCPVPGQADGTTRPPYSATLRRLRHPMFQLCFVIVTVSSVLILLMFFWLIDSALLSVSWVIPGPPAGDTVGQPFLFRLSCVSALFFLALSSVWSNRGVLLLVHPLDITCNIFVTV